MDIILSPGWQFLPVTIEFDGLNLLRGFWVEKEVQETTQRPTERKRIHNKFKQHVCEMTFRNIARLLSNGNMMAKNY